MPETKDCVGAILALLLFFGFLLVVSKKDVKIRAEDIESFISFYDETRDKEVFEKYNKDYSVSKEKTKQIMVKIEKPIKYAFELVNNYVSNVSGKIMDAEIIENENKENVVLFILDVPVNALYSDNLQGEIDLYGVYKAFVKAGPESNTSSEILCLIPISEEYEKVKEIIDKERPSLFTNKY